MTAGGSIFVRTGEDELVEMRQEGYVSEDELQRLLANHPKLLGGEQISPTDPRRWLLISRETGIPREEGGGSWWALDHLFVDQDAIPTLIEVKRNSDTRIRREVIGQMLDYAANAVTYLPVEGLRTTFEQRCSASGQDARELVADLTDDEVEYDEFWQLVKTNLQAGRIRLVFAADSIPPELQRIVEFLNAQMDPAEVLALQITRYASDGTEALVPRILGQTSAARDRKAAGTAAGEPWDADRFLEHLAQEKGKVAAGVAKRILEWREGRGMGIWWGRGHSYGSFFPKFAHNGKDYFLISCWTSGTIEIQFQHFRKHQPFVAEEARIELLKRFNSIDGLSLPADGINRRPSLQLTELAAPERLRAFIQVLEWAETQIRTALDSRPDNGAT